MISMLGSFAGAGVAMDAVTAGALEGVLADAAGDAAGPVWAARVDNKNTDIKERMGYASRT
jgi:hypothetical protein